MSTLHLPTRRVRTKKNAPNVLRAAIIACILGLVVVTLYFAREKLYVPTVTSVSCTLPDGATCPDAVTSELQRLIGQPLIFSPIKQAASNLTAPTGVSVVSYQRVLPGTVSIVVAPINVLFYLQIPESELAVTITGSTLSLPATDASLMRVQSIDAQTNQEITEHKAVPSWLLETVKQLQLFSSTKQSKIDSVVVRSPFEVYLTLTDEPHPMLLNPQESNLNLARLSSILDSDQLTAIASKSATLDVRFRLPVLR